MSNHTQQPRYPPYGLKLSPINRRNVTKKSKQSSRVKNNSIKLPPIVSKKSADSYSRKRRAPDDDSNKRHKSKTAKRLYDEIDLIRQMKSIKLGGKKYKKTTGKIK